ncbi:actin-like protein 6B [Nematocida major]|uniref:actin-like protein 6B n=1 Tax=Nematocida major TaxID=1912982 RepID=UPI0020081CFD|nr:actin-like protein 6B [Nematocida major]KAH9387424.1 actin-like protein 6B [Nematocida major]
MYTVGENTVHIADIGDETYKVGYAGSEYPVLFEKTGKSPNEILSHAISELSDDPQSIPLIKIEDPFTHKETRKKTLSHLMESSLCSGVLFINGAVSDCFSFGKSAGLMIRLCGGSTQVIPVVDGYCISGGIRSSVGGKAVTKHVLNLLREKSEKSGTDLLVPPTAIEERQKVALEQMPLFKEKASYKSLPESEKLPFQMEVARCFKESVSFLGHCQPKYYEFATGYSSRVFSERNSIPEQLFLGESAEMERLDPMKQIAGSLEGMGLLDMVKCAMESVDLEYYDMLLGNVMVSGGGSLVPGITERLQADLMRIYPNARVKVNNDRREFSTFFGGSILGSIGATGTLMITKAEYEECGISALERKRSEWVK